MLRVKFVETTRLHLMTRWVVFQKYVRVEKLLCEMENAKTVIFLHSLIPHELHALWQFVQLLEQEWKKMELARIVVNIQYLLLISKVARPLNVTLENLSNLMADATHVLNTKSQDLKRKHALIQFVDLMKGLI